MAGRQNCFAPRAFVAHIAAQTTKDADVPSLIPNSSIYAKNIRLEESIDGQGCIDVVRTSLVFEEGIGIRPCCYVFFCNRREVENMLVLSTHVPTVHSI